MSGLGGTVPLDTMFNPDTYRSTHRSLLDAETLPHWCYNSEEFYRLEVARIFGKAWNFFGRADRIPEPGDYFSVNFVGTPIIVVRDKEMDLRAFANTCRHRGARIVSGEGKCRRFVCPYHGWVYDLDGSLKGCKGMEQTHNFDKASYGLHPIRLETWGGFIFINFDDEAEPLLDYLGDLPEQMRSYNCDDFVLTHVKEYELNCNWKLHIENAVEPYHVPMVHRNTLQKKQAEHSVPVTQGSWLNLREKHDGNTRALLVEDLQHAFPSIKTLAGHAAEGTNFICILPCTLLSLTTDSCWYVELHPEGPNKTRATLGCCFPKATTKLADFEERAAFYYKRWHKGVEEDNGISEVQHQGLLSHLASPGRFSHMEGTTPRLGAWWTDRITQNRNR